MFVAIAINRNTYSLLSVLLLLKFDAATKNIFVLKLLELFKSIKLESFEILVIYQIQVKQGCLTY
jgi:hypothetical protein